MKLETLAQFLIPGDSHYWSDADPRRGISSATQAGIFELLDEAVRNDLSFQELDRLLKIFEDLHRPEAKPALHRILQNPSTTYAGRAAWVLRGFGEKIDPIEPAPPVRFRLYLNDQPWRSVRLNYAMRDPRVPHMGSGSVKTDAEGFVEIPRDEFLDPAKRGTGMRFSAYPSIGSVWKESQYDDAWVAAKVGLPQAFDEVTTVRFTACALPVEMEYATPPPPVKQAAAHFEVTRVASDGSDAGTMNLYFDDRVETPERFTLGTVAPGTYRLSALVPGSARFSSGPIEVKAGMSPVVVKLEKGSHVFASVFIPENARGANEVRPLQNGEDITGQYAPEWKLDREGAIFRGVPKGTYQFRVLSTVEFMRRYNVSEWKAPETARDPDYRDGVDCEGVSVDFTIDDSSPALLDLGKVENQAIPAMRTKAGPMKVITGGAPPP